MPPPTEPTNVDEYLLPGLVVGDITFVDLLHGWATGTGGVMATANGGDSWYVQRASARGVGPVSFLNARRGWTIDGGTLIGTLDGGATWQTIGATNALAGASQLTFLDRLRGWAITTETGCSGAAGCQTTSSLLSTADGGATWRRIPFHQHRPQPSRAPGRRRS